MQKSILFLCLFLGMSHLSQAQFSEAEIGDLAQTSCECADKNGAEGKNSEAVQKILEKCLMEAMRSNPEYFAKIVANGDDTETMTRFGEQVGIQMASKCPAMFIAVAMEEMEKETQGESDSMGLSGKVTGFESGTVSSITFQEDAGRKHTILILEQFQGVEQLGSLEDLKGKKLSLNYEERSIYSSKMKDFVSQKVLVSIRL